jgi:hypothetical protein
MRRILPWQLREEMPELPTGRPQEAPIARDAHQDLRNTQRHDLGIAQPPPRASRPLRQEVVSRAIDTDTEQVEVGVHRGLQVVDA